MPVLQMTLSLLGVLGLIFLSFFGLRMLNRRVSMSGGRLRVIDRAGLGRDSMLLVVAVAGKLMLIGVSAHRVEKIADLDVTESEYIENAFSNANKQGVVPFSDILSSMVGIRKKDAQKETENSDESSNEDNGTHDNKNRG